MRIMLAIDESSYSARVVNMLKALGPSSRTEVKLMTVIPEHTFIGGHTLRRLWGHTSEAQTKKNQEKLANELLNSHIESIRAIGVSVEPIIVWGNPPEQILKCARTNSIDLIIIGTKGSGNAGFPIGSVAQKIMKYAHTNVLLVREDIKRIRRVLLATDGSKHSERTARFLLNIQLPRKTKIIVATSLESHIQALVKMPTLDMKENRQIIATLQETEKESATELITRTKELFHNKGYLTESMLLEGSPAREIIQFSRSINPDLIAVGAKGLSAIENFLLGSVAQRVARFARYSVLIVR
ncbi:MAG: universal stress protein [Dehalococcoidia bacterium]|nr:MAG: universal stress protein [Dehalococcoidia bacterium]